MTVKYMPPHSRYPRDLDTYQTLMKVFNTAEAKLLTDIEVSSDAMDLEVDFDSPPKWSPDGGFIHIEDEDLYYEKGLYRYGGNIEKTILQNISVSSIEPLEINMSMVVNGLEPETTEFNSVAFRGEQYTAIGVLDVSGEEIDFAIKGNGKHGDTARFFFSKPEFFATNVSFVDADVGSIMIAPFTFGYRVKKIIFMQADIEEDGTPKRRIFRMENLHRGLRDTDAVQHKKGEMVRGFIMAEHHSLLVEALLGMEDLIGIDFSEDRQSLDFRLRDLVDLCVEVDDYPCPEVSFTYEAQEGTECLPNGEVVFEVFVTGNFNFYQLNFGDGTNTKDDFNPTHTYPSNSRVEPFVVVSNPDCTVATTLQIEQPTVIDAIPTIPDLICPDIVVPELPLIPDILVPDITPNETIVNIDLPDTSVSIINALLQTQIVNITSIPTVIDISFPDINIPTQISISAPDLPTQINLSVSLDFPTPTGPCYALVPCDGGTSH